MTGPADDSQHHGGAPFLASRASTRFTRVFTWWAREKMIAKKFFAVRLTTDSDEDGVRALDGHDGPVVALINHASWWDPLVMLMLHAAFTPSRGLRAPMDITQLRKFSFFRRLGAFGIDPDDPRSLGAMERHVLDFFRDDPRPTLWATPQGRFADVRTPVVVRPGPAALASKGAAETGREVEAYAVAAEYAFWVDQKPELFLRMVRVRPESRSTTGWLRAMRDAMNENAGELAERVTARDPAGFRALIGGESAGVHPFYDWLLKLRGKGTGITLDQRGEQADCEHADCERADCEEAGHGAVANPGRGAAS